MEPLSWTEKLQSKRNRLFWTLRNRLRFHRQGYRERMETVEPPSEWLDCFRPFLNLPLYRTTMSRNAATLWYLREFDLLSELSTQSSGLRVLDAGCQDFSRLPAFVEYFKNSFFCGLELDAFPLLSDLHSRFDKANYYRSLVPAHSEFRAADFFLLKETFDVILSFYPFVSPHPALAWGIPAEFGQAELWVNSLNRCLTPGGLALVVHQGSWEEDEFLRALESETHTLHLLSRKVAQCPFHEHPYPPHASLYRKEPL